MLVVLDGPAGAGKSTVARRLARHLGVPLIDTGAIYRTLALEARERGVDWDDEDALALLANDLPIAFEPQRAVDDAGDPPQRVTLAGRDVTAQIRTQEISRGASRVSAHPRVRATLLGIQRALGARNCVAEGRDMGTVVFPDATHKFFVTARPEVRARRRRAELAARGEDVPDLETVIAEIEERDLRDSTRAVAPLRQADDAVLVDTSDLDVEAVVSRLLALVRGSGPS